MNISRSKVEALVNLRGVVVALLVDESLVPTIAEALHVASVSNIVVILTEVNPHFRSTPWEEGDVLLHHDV